METEELAEAIARKLTRYNSPVLTTNEALIVVGKNSTSALYRWMDQWKIKQCSQGRWPRRKIDSALQKEAKLTIKRQERGKETSPTS